MYAEDVEEGVGRVHRPGGGHEAGLGFHRGVNLAKSRSKELVNLTYSFFASAGTLSIDGATYELDPDAEGNALYVEYVGDSTCSYSVLGRVVEQVDTISSGRRLSTATGRCSRAPSRGATTTPSPRRRRAFPRAGGDGMASPTYTTRALVLRKTKLGETDLVVTLLAQDGSQVRAVAKGARKPANVFSARLELYSVVDVLCSKGRSLDVVSEARLVASNERVRLDLEHAQRPRRWRSCSTA